MQPDGTQVQRATNPVEAASLSPQAPSPQAAQNQIPEAQRSPTQFTYASFGRRLGAMLLDGLIVGGVIGALTIIVGIIFAAVGIGAGIMESASQGQSDTAIMGITAISIVIQLFEYLLILSYLVLFTGLKGQTLGKKILKIKVIKKSTGNVPGIGGAILREVVGKFASSFIGGLGYFWVLWDREKQTWHDKIAGTIVIKV